MKPRIISIDIGNTRTKAGVVDVEGLTSSLHSACPTSDLPGRLPVILKKLQKAAGRTLPVMLSGGKNTEARRLERIIGEIHDGPFAWVSHHRRLPVSFAYRPPETLGTDRIANALYAAAAYPGKNSIIISSGTAITVDCVEKGKRFLGGTIIAGIDLQLDALHRATRTLPFLRQSGRSSMKLPGKSTESCMITGTLHATAGALNHLVSLYRKKLGGRCAILATGGAWPQTEPFINFSVTRVDDLTLLGTALFTD